MFLTHGVDMTATAGKSKGFRAVVAAAAALAALCFAIPASSQSPDASVRGTDCGPHVDSTPSEATPRQLRRALGCLINVERAERDRKRLRTNRALTGLAKRHARVMVTEDCFRHQCAGERPLRERIEASGYLAAGGRYGYGENLGCSETPAGMVAVWMDSAFNRRNVLNRRFRHFGIGARQGSPFPRGSTQCSPGKGYMTYAVIFGWRKPPAD